MELRHRRHAFVNRASDLNHTASIANSFDPLDTSEGSCCIWTFRFGQCWFEDGELGEDSVVRTFRTTAADGKPYNVTLSLWV